MREAKLYLAKAWSRIRLVPRVNDSSGTGYIHPASMTYTLRNISRRVALRRSTDEFIRLRYYQGYTSAL
jgi:hypothetical protein